jgi:hypothetical protein
VHLSASFGHRRARSRELAFGAAAVVTGRITSASGQPVAGAALAPLVRALRSGAHTRVDRAVVAGSDGAYRVRLGRGPSRIVRLGIRLRADDERLVCSAALVVRVRAGVTLHASPRQVRNGQSVRFSGRLLGRPVPRGGKLVDLQARDAGRWRTFATVRARRRGAFRLHYRFLRTFHPTTFPFRARVRREASYPYALGYSPVVRVRVG